MKVTDEALLALPRERLVKAVQISEFMLGDARQIADPNDTLAALSNRLIEAGIPLDRAVSIVGLLHAEDAASARVWEREHGVRSFTFPYRPETDRSYARSPASEAHRKREWVVLWLPDTPDDAYGIVPELKEAGIIHYVCAPVFMANGMKNSFSFATKSQTGFSAEDFAVFRAVFPAVAACQEILTTHRILREVMRMYVGEEPHRRILAGDVHRGDVMRIRSAILFADMRGFTELTANMIAEEATRLLNSYYDCVVPHIERNSGEVLKFIGDGILAIFRAEDEGHEACAKADLASRQAVDTVADRNRQQHPPFEIGIALHFGEVAYGNVGSGVRLDYTVIGRDVNVASRIAALCGSLDEPLLASQAFRERCRDGGMVSRGRHAIKGIADGQEVFAPPPYNRKPSSP